VKETLRKFPGKAYFVLSKEDEEYFRKTGKKYLRKTSRLQIFKDFGKVKLGNKKIAFTHLPRTAMILAFSQKYDLVFYGHLHRPEEARILKTRLVNPGNIAGIFFEPTFAIYDTETDKLELNPV